MSLIDISGGIDQARIIKLRHQLTAHPLMATESLGALALRIDPRFVRFHDGERQFATSMSDMLKSDPTREGLRKTLDNLHRARAFVQIINVRSDHAYGALIDAFLDEVAHGLPKEDRLLLNRDAAAFLASPASVTPFHIDHEQNFLCHIRGKKTLWVWSPFDREAVSERALELFFREGTQREVKYSPHLQARARELHLEPGDAIFMPMGSPHAVATGDEIAVTFSVLLNTRSSMELVDTYRANHLLRRFGLSPPPVGQSWMQDALKRRGLAAVRRVFELASGRRASSAPQWY